MNYKLDKDIFIDCLNKVSEIEEKTCIKVCKGIDEDIEYNLYCNKSISVDLKIQYRVNPSARSPYVVTISTADGTKPHSELSFLFGSWRSLSIEEVADILIETWNKVLVRDERV